MGYIAHNAIIVTAGHDLTEAHAVALAIFDDRHVTPVIGPVINGTYSFMIGPDGSKEGWPDSDVGDTRRAQFLEWAHRANRDGDQSWFDFVEIRYGGDEPERARIIDDGDVQL